MNMDSWRKANFGDFDDFPYWENPLEKLLLDIENIDKYRLFFGEEFLKQSTKRVTCGRWW